MSAASPRVASRVAPPPPHTTPLGSPRLAVVVKGYPRLSETFVAQELYGLEQRGVPFDIWSLRHPTDDRTHPIHDRISAAKRYLPEYLHHEPWRVVKGVASQLGRKGLWRAAGVWLRDLARDRTVNRIRRFGQAAVLARELPGEIDFLYVHFLHTPGSTARYAALMRGIGWGFSAHAKDIWTIPDWEKREKLAAATFGLTCTRVGAEHLQSLAPEPGRVRLVYHGLDLDRFPTPPPERPAHDGQQGSTVTILSVGRLVEKKGYDDLLHALAKLPSELNWRFEHIGGGPLKAALSELAATLGIAERVRWRGALDQTDVIAAMQAADLFVLPSRIAGDGDRDGLPNVLMEAASQKLPVISTTVSAIPEFIEKGASGLLVPPSDPAALSAALTASITDPKGRAERAGVLYERLTRDFGAAAGIDAVAATLIQAAPRVQLPSTAAALA